MVLPVFSKFTFSIDFSENFEPDDIDPDAVRILQSKIRNVLPYTRVLNENKYFNIWTRCPN